MIRQIFICECYSIYPNFYRTAFSGERERSTDSSASDGMLINGMFKRLRMSCRWGDFDARIIGSIGTSIKEEYQKDKQKIEFRGRIQCGNILDLFDNFRFRIGDKFTQRIARYPVQKGQFPNRCIIDQKNSTA